MAELALLTASLLIKSLLTAEFLPVAMHYHPELQLLNCRDVGYAIAASHRSPHHMHVGTESAYDG